MNAVLAAFVVWLLAISPLNAASEDMCGIPPSLVEVFAHLPRVSKTVKQDKRLKVLVLSAAATQTGPASTLKTYPAALESSLRARLKGVTVDVTAFAVPRKTVEGFEPVLPKVLDQQKPDLVVWQTGTIDAMRGIDPDVFGDRLQFAITLILKSGADVVLINPQYGPHTSFLFNVGPYIDNIRWVGQTKDVPVFNRHEIMKYWGENDIFDLTAMRSNGAYEKLHKCLGRLLSDFIIRAGSLPGGQER